MKLHIHNEEFSKYKDCRQFYVQKINCQPMGQKARGKHTHIDESTTKD